MINQSVCERRLRFHEARDVVVGAVTNDTS